MNSSHYHWLFNLLVLLFGWFLFRHVHTSSSIVCRDCYYYYNCQYYYKIFSLYKHSLLGDFFWVFSFKVLSLTGNLLPGNLNKQSVFADFGSLKCNNYNHYAIAKIQFHLFSYFYQGHILPSERFSGSLVCS